MRGFIAISSILLMVFFQNCGSGTQDASPSLEESTEVSGKVPMGKMDTPQSITVHPQLNPIEIDLKTGELKVISPRSPLVGKCLQASELEFLNEILKDSEICEIHNKVPDGVNCSMALVPAYAHIKKSDGQSVVELGAASNGCREFSMDLCEGSQLLQSWVEVIDQDSKFEDCP